MFDEYAWKFQDSAYTESCSEGFNFILSFSCKIVSTKVFVSCFLENVKIPSGLECIYSLAMKDLIVCPSGLTLSEKKSFRSMITKMGGHFTDSLKDVCTNLISTSTKTRKYVVASERKMIVMHPNWIEDVWKCCLEGQNVQGNDKQFDKFKLPIFYGCCITATGLPTAERNLIKTLVEENGGKYSGTFDSDKVNVVIAPRDKTDSAKFHAAQKYRKECLTSDWIREYFDLSITHLICEEPNRGQKYLSALAAGRFILHSKYIEDSAKNGSFLEEASYEFGNPKFSVDIKLAPKFVELAASAYRWRIKIKSDGKYRDGAFTGYKVLLINSGGGLVYEGNLLLSGSNF